MYIIISIYIINLYNTKKYTVSNNLFVFFVRPKLDTNLDPNPITLLGTAPAVES